MIVEHVWIKIKEGQEEAYETSLQSAFPIIEGAPDCFGAEIRRQIEDPSCYLLMITWSSVESHMAFRNSERFEQWRDLTLPFYDVPSQVTHFNEPIAH